MSGPAFFLAASGVYCALLAAWLQQPGVLAACAAAVRSCSPLPDVSAPAMGQRPCRHLVTVMFAATFSSTKCMMHLQVHAVASMFRTAEVTVVAWLHLLLLDIFQARSVTVNTINNLW